MSDEWRFAWKLLALLGIMGLIYYIPGPVFNVIVDPYGIFHDDATRQSAVPNERWVKMRYLLEHPDRYDTFLFGSSRVNNMDVRKLPGRPYDAFTTAATPQEHLADIRFLLAHGVTIHRIYLGLDETSYTHDPHIDATLLSSIEYPKDGNLLPAELMYFFVPPDPGVMTEAIHPKETINYDYASSGRALFPEREYEIDQDPVRHALAFQATTLIPGVHAPDPSLEAQAIQAIRDLHDLCKKQGIQLTVFINPVSARAFRLQNADAYDAFLKSLASITDYMDFSGVNTTTTDPQNYYEYSHYRPRVGDAVLDVLLGNVSSTSFGVQVTAQNVDEHLEDLRRQLSKTP